MLNAALYIRKSNEQTGIAADQKSVAVQLDLAAQYVAKKGWHSDPSITYVDDGISGAAFAKRSGLLRLLDDLKPTPKFSVVVMSEHSRLGRESIETSYLFKQLIDAGVRVFNYQTNEEITLNSAQDKLLLSLHTFAAEIERERTRQRVSGALRRKAQAGHVASGAAAYGYENVSVYGDQNGQQVRLRVERKINAAQAKVVRRIFGWAVQGWGYRRIARTLNDDGVPAMKRKDGNGLWLPETISAMLKRRIYIGILDYATTDQGGYKQGKKKTVKRPESEWVVVQAPHLRIIDDATWQALADKRESNKLDADDPRFQGRPRDDNSHYLLTGFGRCAECGGNMMVARRGKNSRLLVCSRNHRQGSSFCSNNLRKPIQQIDAVLLSMIKTQLLNPAVIEGLVDRVCAKLNPASKETGHAAAELAKLDKEMKRLSNAIAVSGGDLEPLLDALRTRQAKAAQLKAQLQRTLAAKPLDRKLVEKVAQQWLTSWTRLLSAEKKIEKGREFLRSGATVLQFKEKNGEYLITGTFDGQAILHATATSQSQTSGPRSSQVWTMTLTGSTRAA